MRTNVEKRFFNISELAVYLSVSEDTVRNWKKRGEIPFSKFGRSVRFDMRKIDKWIEKREVKIAFEAKI